MSGASAVELAIHAAVRSLRTSRVPPAMLPHAILPRSCYVCNMISFSRATLLRTTRRCHLFACAASGVQSVSPCALCFPQIVGAAFCYFIYAGTILSARFDAGGSLDGRLRGLYPGWLFGRRTASLHTPCWLARAWCTSGLQCRSIQSRLALHPPHVANLPLHVVTRSMRQARMHEKKESMCGVSPQAKRNLRKGSLCRVLQATLLRATL